MNNDGDWGQCYFCPDNMYLTKSLFLLDSIQIPMKLRSRYTVTWGVTGVQEQTEGHQRAEQRQGAHDSSSAVDAAECGVCCVSDGWLVRSGVLGQELRYESMRLFHRVAGSIQCSRGQTNKQTPFYKPHSEHRTSSRQSGIRPRVLGYDPVGGWTSRADVTDTNISEEQPSPFP